MKKEVPQKPDPEAAILGAFIFFNAVERGMTAQAFFDALRPMGWGNKFILKRLQHMVTKGLLTIEPHSEFGDIYRPAKMDMSRLN